MLSANMCCALGTHLSQIRHRQVTGGSLRTSSEPSSKFPTRLFQEKDLFSGKLSSRRIVPSHVSHPVMARGPLVAVGLRFIVSLVLWHVRWRGLPSFYPLGISASVLLYTPFVTATSMHV